MASSSEEDYQIAEEDEDDVMSRGSRARGSRSRSRSNHNVKKRKIDQISCDSVMVNHNDRKDMLWTDKYAP